MQLLGKYLYHKRGAGTERWNPVLAFYYLTNSCDFKCPYCTSGPFMRDDCREPQSILPGEKVISLLKVIRQYTDYLVITGGEPLTHPDFSYVMEKAKELRFKKIFLASNGYLLNKYLPVIAASVDYMVVSLDTLNEEKARRLTGHGNGTLKTILANLEELAQYPGRKKPVSVSGVVTPDNIEDLYEVYWYTQERNFEFAAAPQLEGVRAHTGLNGSERYRQFYNFLIAQKKKGGKIFGSLQYLEYMRDLRNFDCYPFVMLVVSPLGDVWYPCMEGGEIVDNLLEEPNLDRIYQKGQEQYGTAPVCDNRCHSACMMGFSLALRYPGALVHEAWLQVKNMGRNR
ncbi:MAG: radical SAM protein [bacterium]|nr:radical SAM protein [bacterium]